MKRRDTTEDINKPSTDLVKLMGRLEWSFKRKIHSLSQFMTMLLIGPATLQSIQEVDERNC